MYNELNLSTLNGTFNLSAIFVSLECLQAGRLERLRLSGSNQGKPKWPELRTQILLVTHVYSM